MAESTRVIVGVSGSRRSTAVLQRAAAEAARRGAELVPVIAWTPVGGETAYRTHPCPPLAAAWEQAARTRLDQVFAEAFGGYPENLRITPVVIQGEAGPSLLQVADRADDLLVVGTGRRGLLRPLFARVSRYCLARAHCTVIAVPAEAEPTAVNRRRGRGHLAMAA
ncbi:universal stress protein [Kitasatospora sp. GAS204B]|uniref:universal stress protein n=1 Tax=unclassified Kitasatospora TaxID=2633591 RepID=UPI00247551EC|nr:universal stress protein [Kitasatospora sp. GAS204B]MDH6120345.1 nucleotide-binding universal stress UspA family protein [Kitasatospora sp. GAS204B]